MFTNYSLTVHNDTAVGANVSLYLTSTEYYTINDGEEDYTFQVVSIVDKDTVNITWVQLLGNPQIKPSILPTTVTAVDRGFSSTTPSLYKLNLLRRGYLDIDSIIFDLFFKSIYRWTWNGPTHTSEFEQGTTNFVDFFFFNKRPVVRQPTADRNVGAVDSVDSAWRNSTESSNPTSIKQMPYLVFQPLETVPTPDDLYRVEEFYRAIENVPQEMLDNEYKDVEMYQPPQLYEFSYQITAVTDSWKDCRILQSHLYNSVVPLDRGERYLTFPSGMSHTLTVENSGITPLEEEGVFETTTTYTFTLPLIDQAPELTWSWVTGILNIDNTDSTSIDMDPDVGPAIEISDTFGDLWGTSGEVEW